MIPMRNAIEFFVWETDTYSLVVTLEPEANEFVVRPGERLAFAPSSPTEDFHWAMRIDHQRHSIQLYPESRENYGDIEIYKNGVLDENWESLL
jgi:hypothetical protein